MEPTTKPETEIVPMDRVDPPHSRPPEGMVLPKIPPSIYGIVSIVVVVALIVIASVEYYYNVAR